MEVKIIPQLENNYCYLVTNPTLENGKNAIIIDPSEAGSIVSVLSEMGIQGGYILNTHHHADHTQGNLPLKQGYNFEIFANAEDIHRIPGIDHPLHGEGSLKILNTPVEFLRSPGHTRSHLLFHFPETGELFCGDTLFLLGCGRIFEGNAQELFESLQRIGTLAPTTRLWCGHEYTLKNLEFAESILGSQDAGLSRVSTKYRAARRAGRPTFPGILGEEIAANPFFRCGESTVKKALGLADSTSAAVCFARLRERRNQF